MQRRTLLKALSAGGAAIALGAGLFTPSRLLAAGPSSAFGAKSFNDALSTLFGHTQLQSSDSIEIQAPAIAENGAVVPVTVSSTLGKLEEIAVFVEGNPTPLVCRCDVSQALPYVSTRIKMGKTSDVIAVARRGTELLTARTNIKVTIGGCGG